MNRNRQIEIAKFIGIILVVVGHSFGAGVFAAKLYHMPLFFFISGLTLNTGDKFSVFIEKRIKRLYIPFIIYEVVYLFVSPWFYQIGIGTDRYDNINEVISALLHIVLFDNYNILLSPIWFVTALFFSSICAYWLYKIVSLVKYTLLHAGGAVLLVYIGLWLGKADALLLPHSYNFPKSVSVVIMACGYILLGIIVNDSSELTILIGKNKLQHVIYMVVFILLIIFERITLLHADMRSNSYDYMLLQPIFAIIGISAVFIMSNIFTNLMDKFDLVYVRKVAMYVSSHTFSIMCLHPVSFKVVGIVQVYALGFNKEKLAG